jgi:hypothetical protein
MRFRKAFEKRACRGELFLQEIGMNRVPRLWRSGMLGFPPIPSPTGLGSRLASGPYGPASFGPQRIGLPLSLSAAPTRQYRDCNHLQIAGFPPIPSPTGLGSRLASGPYGPASFGSEHIGLPLSLSAAPTRQYRDCNHLQWLLTLGPFSYYTARKSLHTRLLLRGTSCISCLSRRDKDHSARLFLRCAVAREHRNFHLLQPSAHVRARASSYAETPAPKHRSSSRARVAGP